MLLRSRPIEVCRSTRGVPRNRLSRVLPKQHYTTRCPTRMGVALYLTHVLRENPPRQPSRRMLQRHRGHLRPGLRRLRGGVDCRAVASSSRCRTPAPTLRSCRKLGKAKDRSREDRAASVFAPYCREKPAGVNRRAELQSLRTTSPTKPFCRPDEAVRKQSSALIP
jgi:hypothetical protein